MNDILAKSEPPITLKQHIEDGLSVWESLKDAFPMAPKCAQSENFWRLLWICVVTHDLGKAHSEFQKVLRGQNNEWHSQRHELFSLPFVKNLNLSKHEKTLVLRVVAAHHRSYDFLSQFIEDNYEYDPAEFDKEFSKIKIEQVLNLLDSFEEGLIKEDEDFSTESPQRIIRAYQKEVKQVIIGRTKEIANFATTLLLMGAFHHCDHLSSAFVTEFPCMQREDFIFLDRLRNKLKSENLQFYYHQKAAAEIVGNVILTAPTGSGKTETSMLWLRKQLQDVGQGRVFYILPFTASINAMFERLSHDQEGLGKSMVGMLHGKLDAYLYDSFFEEAGNLSKLKESITSLKQTFKNLQTPLKVSTPFQLLKHLFGLKGFEKGIFEWVGGYFIFDEIHAYDPEVTAQIIVLLEFLSSRLNANIFIMTATLPTFLKKMIGNSIENYSDVKAENTLYNKFKRHKIQLIEGLLSNHLLLLEQELAEKDSVLVVCNTVDQAREIYIHFSHKFDTLLIHGRFTAKDRTRIEKQLQSNPPKLLVGTQAIEVSLDIDYDVIFTEPAPLDALIQRFGRINRKRQKEPCPCIVFTERNEKDQYIYKTDLVDRTLEVLKKIASVNNGIIQESELQKHIDTVYPCFDKEAKERYDKIYNLLSLSIQKLTPFNPSKEGEEVFYKQFDGVKVVPAYYEKEYLQKINKFDFIGAEQLKLSIRKNWFARLLADSDIQKELCVLFPSEHPNSKPIEITFFKVNRYYRPDIGLDFENQENTTSNNAENNQIL